MQVCGYSYWNSWSDRGFRERSRDSLVMIDWESSALPAWSMPLHRGLVVCPTQFLPMGFGECPFVCLSVLSSSLFFFSGDKTMDRIILFTVSLKAFPRSSYRWVSESFLLCVSLFLFFLLSRYEYAATNTSTHRGLTVPQKSYRWISESFL